MIGKSEGETVWPAESYKLVMVSMNLIFGRQPDPTKWNMKRTMLR